MPFKSVKQERFLQINNPKLWKEWVKKYGHAPGYEKAIHEKKAKGKKTKK